jgi:hypothetical protein
MADPIKTFEQQYQELMLRPDMGVKIKGIVSVVEEPRTFTGANKDGSSYTSHSRRIELNCGQSGAVVCGERSASLHEFKPLVVGSVVEWRVVGAKTEGKQMVLRVLTV